MDIHEEYHRRQRLKVPLVRYPQESFLWVTREGGRRGGLSWGTLNVSFVQRDADHRPGKMYLSHQVPGRDERYGNLISQQVWVEEKEWDEWGDFIVKWAGRHAKEYPVVPEPCIRRAAWQCFAVSADSYLAQSLTDRLLDRLHVSLTDDGEDGTQAMAEVMDFLGRNAVRGFESHIAKLKAMSEPGCGAAWLSRLLSA